ncbi:unnamed protein product [Effrenium voratum]|nr:unnamed protein product [Effrenium voratum]
MYGAEGKPPKEDVGACVGEILGAAAFVAAAALDIWRAADFECLSALAWSPDVGKPPPRHNELRE